MWRSMWRYLWRRFWRFLGCCDSTSLDGPVISWSDFERRFSIQNTSIEAAAKQVATTIIDNDYCLHARKAACLLDSYLLRRVLHPLLCLGIAKSEYENYSVLDYPTQELPVCCSCSRRGSSFRRHPSRHGQVSIMPDDDFARFPIR